ncbi:MAG: zf-HC2 domain-containing protein [Bacteroidota bacterium]
MSPTLPNPHHPTSEELFAYRDGELPADRRALIEAHVVACAQCRERIDAMSSAEADLRSRPDGVDEEYLERMTESVLAKVGAGMRVVRREPAREEAVRAPESREPAREPATREPATREPAVAAPPSGAREPAGPDLPRIDRRRPDYMEVGVEPKRRLRMPWIGVAGGTAAAVAVVIVAVALFQRQGEWIHAPRPAVVGEPREAAPPPESTIAPTQAEEQAPAAGAVNAPKRERAASAKDKLAGSKKATRGGAPSAESAPVGKSGALRDEALMNRTQAAPETAPPSMQQRKALMAPSPVAGAAPQASSLAAPGEAFGNVIRTYRLPPVWNPGVPSDAVARAEKDLRFLYQMGRAGADSARIRLYLAEAERARLTNPSDIAAVQSISRHYRRAISLAGSDAALAATARQRLNEFEQEMIRRRSATP